MGGEIIGFKKQLFLFWKIGKLVSKKQKCCENVVVKYSNFFSYYYGMSSTFSISNINYMKRFYSCFPLYINKLNNLSFEHYKLLIHICELEERYFYFWVAMFCRSSVEELKLMISNNLYEYI